MTSKLLRFLRSNTAFGLKFLHCTFRIDLL